MASIASGLWAVRLRVFCALGYSDVLQCDAVWRVCIPCPQLSMGNQLFVSVVCLQLKATVLVASQRSSVACMPVLPITHGVYVFVRVWVRADWRALVLHALYPNHVYWCMCTCVCVCWCRRHVLGRGLAVLSTVG